MLLQQQNQLQDGSAQTINNAAPAGTAPPSLGLSILCGTRMLIHCTLAPSCPSNARPAMLHQQYVGAMQYGKAWLTGHSRSGLMMPLLHRCPSRMRVVLRRKPAQVPLPHRCSTVGFRVLRMCRGCGQCAPILERIRQCYGRRLSRGAPHADLGAVRAAVQRRCRLRRLDARRWYASLPLVPESPFVGPACTVPLSAVSSLDDGQSQCAQITLFFPVPPLDPYCGSDVAYVCQRTSQLCCQLSCYHTGRPLLSQRCHH